MASDTKGPQPAEDDLGRKMDRLFEAANPPPASSARDALRLLHNKIAVLSAACVADNLIVWDPKQRAIYALFTLSQQTSRATLQLADEGIVVPALILNRSRVEQLIISSYLVYENAERGIDPFLKHMPIDSFLGVEAAFSDPLLRVLLEPEVDYGKARQDALHAMADLDPDFNAEGDKFQRKWTKLDLLSIARRRDELTASTSSISSRIPLQSLYLSVYKTLSAVVHADSLAISPSFLGAIEFSPKQIPTLSYGWHWIDSIFSGTALCDMIQLYETMLFLRLDTSLDIATLTGEWLKASNEIIAKK